MSRPLLIVRPEPGNRATVARAAARGLDAIGIPLFRIEIVDWVAPPATEYEALLLTSGNAVRHAGAKLKEYLALPVYAVGAATAEAAAAAGFTVVKAGTGSARDLIKELPTLKMLHFSGAHTSDLGQHHHQVDQIITYASHALPLLAPFAVALQQDPIILFHSARAAVHVSAAIDRVVAKSLSCVAISAAVAEAAGDGWEAVALAAHPRDEAMIDAALEMAARQDRAD